MSLPAIIRLRITPAHFPACGPASAAATFTLVMAAFVAALAPQQAAAQEAFMVCDEQRALEQALASDGDFHAPIGCRVMRLSTLDTDQGRFLRYGIRRIR